MRTLAAPAEVHVRGAVDARKLLARDDEHAAEVVREGQREVVLLDGHREVHRRARPRTPVRDAIVAGDRVHVVQHHAVERRHAHRLQEPARVER